MQTRQAWKCTCALIHDDTLLLCSLSSPLSPPLWGGWGASGKNNYREPPQGGNERQYPKTLKRTECRNSMHPNNHDYDNSDMDDAAGNCQAQAASLKDKLPISLSDPTSCLPLLSASTPCLPQSPVSLPPVSLSLLFLSLNLLSLKLLSLNLLSLSLPQSPVSPSISCLSPSIYCVSPSISCVSPSTLCLAVLLSLLWNCVNIVGKIQSCECMLYVFKERRVRWVCSKNFLTMI